MLSETIDEGLGRYDIGPRIRELRQTKNLGLVELGEHTGLSPGMLSRIETGRLYPTLPTLLRIAMVFGIGLEHFFTQDRQRPLREVVRKSDRIRLPDRMGNAHPSYEFESLDFPVEGRRVAAFFAEFHPAGPDTAPHHHPGLERIYVITGTLLLRFPDGDVSLESGDAIAFDATSPHSYQGIGSDRCTGIAVTEDD